jgi:putative intracellular protease/amidase
MAGFRLGIYVFKDAEIVDFAAPHGVWSVARRYDPELDAFLIADARRPVQAQAGFTVVPNYCFDDLPAMDAFLIPGGFGTRQGMYNRRLHEFIRSLGEETLLTSVCTGSWVYACVGLLDGLPATNRKEPDKVESGPSGKVADRPARRDRAGVPDQPGARGRRRADRDRRRHHFGDGVGLPPPPPSRLQREVRAGRRARDGVRRRVRPLPGRSGNGPDRVCAMSEQPDVPGGSRLREYGLLVAGALAGAASNSSQRSIQRWVRSNISRV